MEISGFQWAKSQKSMQTFMLILDSIKGIKQDKFYVFKTQFWNKKMQKFHSVTHLYKDEYTLLSPSHLNLTCFWMNISNYTPLMVLFGTWEAYCSAAMWDNHVFYFTPTESIPNTKGKDMWKGKQQISSLLTYIIFLRLWFGLTPQISWHCELLTRVITIPP